MSFDPKPLLAAAPQSAGVYQMFDAQDRLLYVGKAKNLKKRLSSYFYIKEHAPKTRRLLAQVDRIELTLTKTEKEALLLECSLIKAASPRYNVLLRDDKSYPYIVLSQDSPYPRMTYFRSKKKPEGQFFGPYPNVYAAKAALDVLQKTFRLASCSASMFNNRSRPCLQYQIQRCSAPCVQLISSEMYAKEVSHARLFLNGQSTSLIEQLVDQMDVAAKAKAFEKAARIRDQISQIRKTQQPQDVVRVRGDFDVVAVEEKKGRAVFFLLRIRHGEVTATHCLRSKVPLEQSVSDILQTGLLQWYLSSNDALPKKVLLSPPLLNNALFVSALESEKGQRIEIIQEDEALQSWVHMARRNACAALEENASFDRASAFEMMKHALGLPSSIQRVDCFDISHTQGHATVASCVVADQGEMVSSDYRRFNIKTVNSGDDYAALREAFFRRYQSEEGKKTDLLLIDGGANQLQVGKEVLHELALSRKIEVVSLSKGAARRAGEEVIHRVDAGPLALPADHQGLHWLQLIRDEAHRFALHSHRKKRGKIQSRLEGIEGIGPKRRRTLLHYFGGLKALEEASVEEVAQLPGLSVNLAKKVIDVLKNT